MAERADIASTLEDEPWYEHAKTLRQRPSETIVPPSGTPDANGMRALSALSNIASAGGAGVAAGIELGDTLGEGGMGIVRVGTQVSLGRSVAVKTLKAGITGEAATLKVLREAWITGSLEHPNVVPIYDVGVDSDGRPLIVLKKIEGTEWSRVIGDSAAVRRLFGAQDLLEWNIGILQSVCNAVRFAHSRSVLHRDLKPENVMIGEFGEVYVVDWGIAVSMKDDGSGRLPLAENATEMAGTPYYMAPEMLGGKGVSLSEKSDVYLLGAILYEIVAGAPPHQGTNLMAVVSSVATSKPIVPEDAPEGILEIIGRAMARDPRDRYASVEAFRFALAAFLEHRGSMRLTRDADGRREHLLDHIAATEASDQGARDRIYNLFSECRFGYRGALDAWRENEVARDHLRSATEAMIRYELAQDDPRAAAALAASLDEVPEDTKARIETATADKATRNARLSSLADLGREEDREVGRRTRTFLAWALGSFWVAVPLTVAIWGMEGAQSWGMTFAMSFMSFGIVAVAGFWARDSLTKTAFNRRVGGAVLVGLGMEIPLHLGHWLIGDTPVQSQVQAFLLWAAVAAFSVFAIDKRLAITALAMTAAYLVASVEPNLRWSVMTASSIVMLGNMMWIWRVRRADVEDGIRRRLSRLTDRPPSPR